ncbi:hypothetical protein Tco_1470230, partial [Tanacetum coccineum]
PALLDSNPGSTCRLDVDKSLNRTVSFKRMYICFKGVKDGWRCAIFENGISKSFNRAIFSPRHKLIITMLEEIRLYIMKILVIMNKIAFSLEERITPSIRKREWIVFPSGFQDLEVRKGNQSYGVNLQHKKHVVVSQCASRGGGSKRGGGNDASGSGMGGIGDASGSGIGGSGSGGRGGETSSRGGGRGRRGGGMASRGGKRGSRGGGGKRGGAMAGSSSMGVLTDEEIRKEENNKNGKKSMITLILLIG